MEQRQIERQGWQRFAYVCDVNDLVVEVRRGILEPMEANVACNTTIIIERVMRLRPLR